MPIIRKIVFLSFILLMTTVLKANKIIIIALSFLLFLACSTKRDTFLNRNFQALNTKYNVNFNSEQAYLKGLDEMNLAETDDFWETLDVDKTLTPQEIKSLEEEIKRDPNFERAEDKAAAAIQKRSMNIDGSERNYLVDNSFLLLGQSRYFENRYLPALEAFNYILYKYPNSNKLADAKLWREKTNIKLNFNEEAIKGLKLLLTNDSIENDKVKGISRLFKKRGLLTKPLRADAHAALAQAYLNKSYKDSAVFSIKTAISLNKDDIKNARHNFILAQIYESQKLPDSASMAYEQIINMNRNAPKIFAMQAYGKNFVLKDIKADTTIAFEAYDKKIADYENKKYLDILHHYRGLSYEKIKSNDLAIKSYKNALKNKGTDLYLAASSYRNIANIHFDEAKFLDASKYYDSTLVFLNVKTREYRNLKKRREDLNDVIYYEGIAKENDSILYVLGLSEEEKLGYYKKYVTNLEKQDKIDEAKRLKAQELEEDASLRNPVANNFASKNSNANPSGLSDFPSLGSDEKADVDLGPKTPSAPRQSSTSQQSNFGQGNSGDFYFYSFTLAENGKAEFTRNWGKRKAKGHWSVLALSKALMNEQEEESKKSDTLSAAQKEEQNLRYDPNFYISRLPNIDQIPALEKDRNFAYYQLGLIYKEKFKRYPLAADRLEKLLTLKPEERLILPANYNLFKIYELLKDPKANQFKNFIVTNYPQSRYAQILLGQNIPDEDLDNNPQLAYKKVYKTLEKEDLNEALRLTNIGIEKFEGDEIKPKFELLKATINGRIKGLQTYKSSLEYVFLNYPSTEEGKQASEIFKTKIPELEKMSFDMAQVKKPKMVYVFDVKDQAGIKALKDKLIKFIGERTDLKIIEEYFTENERFLVINGATDVDNINSYIGFMEKHKDYLIAKKPIIISSHNYTVLQLNKDLAKYKGLTTN